jgi:NAD+ synthase
MAHWEVSRRLLEDMSVREESLEKIRRLEARWYAQRDLTTPETFSLMVEWTREEVEMTGTKGALLGVSGGVDSSLGALILKNALPDRCLGLLLPCHSDEADLDDGRRLMELIGMPYSVIALDRVQDAFVDLLDGGGEPAGNLVKGNLASRLRNAAMYYEANRRGYLVLGTGDLDEVYIGYASKGTASDIFPMNGLHKDEVRVHLKRELSRYDKSFAERIAGRPASPGYWKGQMAEDEIGVSYTNIGMILDIFLSHCDIWSTGILPSNPSTFQEALTERGIKDEDAMRVASLIIRNYHKSFSSPSLGRPGI